ncbi:MAG: MFS transporter [Ruminococcaceae bacterium]|nr:MFS transporter [Oscillospiraceae bacterium]
MSKKLTYKSTAVSCYIGFAVQAIINNFPSLLFVIFRTYLGITISQLATLVSTLFLTQLAVDIFSIKWVDKMGYRLTAVISHVFSTIGLVLLGILPRVMTHSYVALIICSIIYAIGAGFQETVLSPIVESISDELDSGAMSILHSFYCLGQCLTVVVTTVFIKIFGEQYWYVLAWLLALVPAYNTYRFARVPMRRTLSEEEKTPLKELFSSRIFIVAMIVMVGGGASELSMVQWSSMFAEKGLGVSKVVGDLLGPCLFAVFMFIGRTVCGKTEGRFNLQKALMVCSAGSFVCYVTAAVSLNPFISLAGCALCGFAVSIMWPGTLTLASSRYPKGGASMFGVLALCGDLGCSFGPWLSGKVSDIARQNEQIVNFATRFSLDAEQAGLRMGMLAASVFPLVILFGLMFFREKKRTK